MASPADIRKRIRSVRNSQKITAAMKLVAAAKLKRAQETNLRARPYAQQMAALLARVAGRAEHAHPLLEVRPARRILLMVMTSDRGLCGPFNSNVLRAAERFLRQPRDGCERLSLGTVGRKGRDYFKKRQWATVRDFPGVFEDLSFRRASEISSGLIGEFTSQQLDAVYLIYNEFKSAISQRVSLVQLLPIAAAELPATSALIETEEYLYEPTQRAVLDALIPRYVATMVWRSLLESWASEQGARMAAMDAATKNAREILSVLTLQYNRVRQAAITRELMEIIGGAEAL